MELGVSIESPLLKQILHRLAMAFVDDTDFYSSREHFREIMQVIIDLYTRLYEAMGRKIQQQKIMYYCWKWVYECGIKKIK